MYAAFGHTAIRVFDPEVRLDYVFNYGTFVVDEGFYVRFVKGRMDYRLGVERYGRFQNLYLRQGRALHEQVLNLAPEDVKAMAEYLEWNAQPENATYAYDFFRDNCATKVIAVLEEVFGDRYDAGCVPTDSTYLEALRPYTAGNPWSAWGMELILGAEASTAMPDCGHSFLPDVLAYQIDAMTLDGQPLAFEREVVYPHQGSWHAGLPEGDSGASVAGLPHVGVGGVDGIGSPDGAPRGRMEAVGSARVGGRHRVGVCPHGDAVCADGVGDRPQRHVVERRHGLGVGGMGCDMGGRSEVARCSSRGHGAGAQGGCGVDDAGFGIGVHRAGVAVGLGMG